MEFTKFDDKKLDYSLLPLEAVEELVKVLQHGADKYEKDNWRKCTDLDRYFSALLRHLFAWKKGETVDPDSGLPHLAHVACNAMFLLELGKMPHK